MALSRLWTVESFFKHIMAELQNDNPLAYAQRMEIINQVQAMVADQIYNAVWSSYMTPVILAVDTVGKYSTAATGTYMASSLTLSVPTIAFVAGDAGKVVVFRKSTDVYIAFIVSVTNATDVILSGNALPAANLATIDEVLVVATVPTMSMVNLSSLKIMRSGEPMRLQLGSSQTRNVEPVSAEDVRVFMPDAPQNLNKIVWNFTGEELVFAYGSSLTTLGTLTLRYPRIPIPVTADTDSLDLPDGIATQIAMLVTKKIVAERYGNTPQNYAQEMNTLVTELYRNMGMLVNQEEVKSKVQALS